MRLLYTGLLLLLFSSEATIQRAMADPVQQREALTIGESFTLESEILGETRRINVYVPPHYSAEERLPVLYMPDGGIAEDFLHIAGLLQISVLNGTTRPFMLVGIENTERRRDLTGPTDNEEDKQIAPRVGGSAAFREFLRSELMPEINASYPVTEETAIVGESLAGLFVVETLLLEPDLFDTYIAFDPSLWWNDQQLVAEAIGLLAEHPDLNATLYLAASDQAEIEGITSEFVKLLREENPPGIELHYTPMPGEHHSTIYHPGALLAFRALFAPVAELPSD